ncbi:MAG: ABC transporter substrate-binding protein, partial [Rhizobiales bacterium]|nr:ABC transporter substrate-binding protein [Hyphomicrobiales bacterium]
MKLIRYLWALSAALLLAVTLVHAEPRHGIAMHGEPALPPDFKNFPYANPDAPQGGILRQAITGSFDSVNPFVVKGQKATGVNVYVYESLMTRNWAEPFALYCHICETIDVSGDRQTFTFKLRPEAKFSDGKPVTSADVAFTVNLLREKALPRYRNTPSAVESVETPDPLTVIFKQTGGNRELPLLVGFLPILPKHYWEGRDFEATTFDPIVGSGPYTIGTIKPGETIVYKRNRDWWANGRPESRGFWNFDEVRFEYYRDANATFEAFKGGLADARIESDPVKWSSGYDFPAVKEGKVILETVTAKSPASASGLIFNTRRDIFKDKRVREALVQAFDFEWANANLFANAFRRTHGYFSGSELSSKGIPASDAELAILGGAAATLHPAILDGTYALPVTDGSGQDRKVMRKAVQLLAAAGYKQSDGRMVDSAGTPLSFTLAILTREQEKIALHYQRALQLMGIDMQLRLLDSPQFTRITSEFDFDIVPFSVFNSLSPGNEQRNLWHSATRDVPGSRNLAGVADPTIDAAIDALLKANT